MEAKETYIGAKQTCLCSCDASSSSLGKETGTEAKQTSMEAKETGMEAKQTCLCSCDASSSSFALVFGLVKGPGFQFHGLGFLV